MAALHVATLGSGQNWTSQVTGSIVASASAHDFSRRRSPDKAAEDLRRAEQLHKQTQQLQQNEAMQQRLRNIQNMVAAQQKRMQLQQQVEDAQKKIQQVQQQTEAMQKRLQVLRTHTTHGLMATQQRVQAQQQQTQEILKRVQDMRAVHHHRVQPLVASALAAPKLPPAMRHQMVLQQVMSRLRHQHHTGVGHTSPSQLAIVRAGSIGHHHSVLLATMARIRNPYQHGHSLFQRGHHHYQPLQHALYHRMLHKLSHHHHHRRDRETKQPETVAKATVTTTNKGTTSGVSLDGLGNASNAQSTTNLPAAPVASTVVAAVADTTNRPTDWSMQKLGGPQQPKSDDNAASSAKLKNVDQTTKKDDAKKEDSSPDPDAKSQKQGGRNGGSSGRINLLPGSPNSFVPNEVLAFNFSKAGRQLADQRKFTVEEDFTLNALNFTVTRLKAPADQPDPLSAINALVKDTPANSYDYNRVYVPYRTTSEASPSGAPPASRPVPKLAPGGGSAAGTFCPAERCFGPTLIKWQPQLSACARNVKIGVIDTDYDRNHPAFSRSGSQIIGGNDNILPPRTTKASNVHGTAVLSLLVGETGTSTQGLLAGEKIYYQGAFFKDSNGNAMSNTSTMLRALDFMLESKVDVLNLSFAGPKDVQVHEALVKLAKSGTVILAAAGNDGPQADPTYPAAYPEVVAVTAVDRNMAVYPYANRGKHIAVAAPGVDIWTAIPDKREGAQTGTSFAVPFATSVVALNYPSADQRRNGDAMAPRQRALELLQKDIRPIAGGNRSIFGAGLVQAPSHCDPHAAPATVAGWTSKVEVAPPVQGGNPWTGTVHPVSSKK